MRDIAWLVLPQLPISGQRFEGGKRPRILAGCSPRAPLSSSSSGGGGSASGDFTYNSDFSDGEIDGYTSEFHSYLEEQKREAYQKLNRLIGDGGVIDKDLLRDRTIILVSDGFGNNLSALDVALGFLKSIRIEKLVVAVPVCDVSAVDRLHITVDDLHILDVKGNYMGTDHYYEDNSLPSREETVEKINQVILNWG